MAANWTRFAALAVALVVPAIGCSAQDADDDPGMDDETAPADEANEELRAAVSCKEVTQAAYVHGTQSSIVTITVGGKAVSKPTGHAFLKMQAAADAAGVKLSLASGFRTMQSQQYLYSCYQTKSCNGGHEAAKPGYSNHQSGVAVDVSTSSWLAKNAASFGFFRTVPSEAWHYEYQQGKDPGGPCTKASAAPSAVPPPSDATQPGTPATPAPTATDPNSGTAPPSGDALSWVGIAEDGTYDNGIMLSVHTSDPTIVKIDYHEGNFELTTSTDAADDFPHFWTFGVLGDKSITADGYDANGTLVSSNTIDITLQ